MDLKKYLFYVISSIPKGKVLRYSDLLDSLGSVYARKFVLEALKNAPPGLPIHRVVRSDGFVGEHPWGRRYKEELLKKEGIEIKDGYIKDLDVYLWKDYPKLRPLEMYRKEQEKIVKSIILEDRFENIEIVGGVDLSYNGDVGYAVLVLLDEDMNLLMDVVEKGKIDFPYIPTFLAFREYPLIEKAFKRIRRKPDILFVNGHGISHPIKCGLATFTGVKLDIPTIGVTKKILVGKVEDGKIIYKGEILGFELEKFGNKVYVSPGHKVSLETSKELAEKFWVKGRYPEPIRLADEISKRVRKE